MTQSKIFSKGNLKGLTPGLQDQIIQRFNDYDTIVRVMKLTAANLIDLANTSKSISISDKADIIYLSKRLRNATIPEWLRANNLFY